MKEVNCDITFIASIEDILGNCDNKIDYVNLKKTVISYVKKWLVLFNKTYGYDLQFVKYLGTNVVTVSINKQDVKSLFKVIHTEEYKEANKLLFRIWKNTEDDPIIYPKDRRYKRHKWHFKLAIAMLSDSKKMIKKSKEIKINVSNSLSVRGIGFYLDYKNNKI